MRSDFRGLTGWTKNSFIDFPGTVSTVFFFSGCNLRCPYCHNCSFITAPEDLSCRSNDIWDFLIKRKKVIDGVVFSGGEPTLHKHIINLRKEIGDLGYRVMLDTNGLLPDVIEKFSPDYLAVDFKTAPHLYPSLLKATYDDVLSRLSRSLAIVRQMEALAEVRITVAPKIITRPILLTMRTMLEGVEKVYLQPLNLRQKILEPSFFELSPPITTDEIKEFKEILDPVVGSCIIRNE